MKTTRVRKILKNSRKHWVGNGFYVSTLWSPGTSLYEYTNPFLMLDYASPLEFSPSEKERRGVGVHPHRGFETVTFSIFGEVEHRDSSGGGGIICPGDVQWMSAASGVVHDEFHSDNFTKKGGLFSMVQLWVNLPSEHKMGKPRYQSIKSEEFERFKSDDFNVKVIAGSFEGLDGKCETYTNMDVYDISFKKDSVFKTTYFKNRNYIALILDGSLTINNETYSGEVALSLESLNDELSLSAVKGSRVLLMSGEPINEPVASYGPFVMNTKDELVQAVEDFNAGRMGNL
ncbi:hypothetical protein BIY24_04215 [Halobacteriovorax marinus]|uniref:pirin family protein n=1 Tax=Halobacteriovorax marinus TaxID=97084 RepID=UPI000BC2E27D|nr:pirin family protein [Halobacteriovorax marinus]ATH07170.1 hypothetical protein BIY24_04215 [Halobacteriovorax marinus]